MEYRGRSPSDSDSWLRGGHQVSADLTLFYVGLPSDEKNSKTTECRKIDMD